jgi:PAS domain S-box-containing protein
MAEPTIDTKLGAEIQLITRTNILVVDDRPDGLLALEAVLCSDQYDLIKASSGQEALQHALFNDFAVILLDVQMPGMDGFQTASLLRENHRSKDTPIIFVTAINKEIRHINQGYESGAVDYIFKPFDPFILRSKVHIFVDLFKKNLQIKQQAALLRHLESQEKERQISELTQESYRSYTHLADAVPHSIIKVKPSGEVEYFNQQWLDYTGFKLEIDWKSLAHPKDRRKFLVFWLRMCRHNMQAYEVEIRLRCAQDGIYRWHLVRAVPDIKNGENICWIVSCTDIDNIKRTEESFKVLSQELNRSNKELEEYAYVASHDLKEPLHVVSSFVYLLEKRFQPKLDDHEKQYLKFIKEGIGQAQRLIKDLLEYSCIGKTKSFELVDVTSVLTDVFTNLRIIIDETGAGIHYDPMPQITANYFEMTQLFQNLIVNAIKYRSQKPLEIRITARSEGGMWVFSIKDNGIGIDSQFKERIFDMFQRLHAKNEYSGTGIGLAICKKIVENHGGKIWLDSASGDGTTFYFTIKQGL